MNRLYVFDVRYVLGGEEYKKSWLLAWPEEGFQLRKENNAEIKQILSEEHGKEVKVIETDLEEF